MDEDGEFALLERAWPTEVLDNGQWMDGRVDGG